MNLGIEGEGALCLASASAAPGPWRRTGAGW